jgi:NAD(P)H-nitrite reductase large subunit
LVTGASPEEIEGADGQVRVIKLTDGQSIETRMVIFSTGIKANVGLAAAADLITDRHINVDVKMQTNDPDIYAAGDCAICQGVSYGIWNQALEMGKVAGANAVGDDLSYEEVIPANSFSGMNTAVFSVGDIGRDSQKKYKTLELSDAAKASYEKLYFFNNRFTGGILMGDVSKAARLMEAFKKQEPMEKML